MRFSSGGITTRAIVALVAIVGLLGSVPTVSFSQRSTGTSNGQEEPTIDVLVVTAADNGKLVHITRSQVLAVKLPTQPGSGYVWRVSPLSAAQFNTVGSTVQATTGTPGSPETCILQIQPKDVGHTLLRLDYVRPWEVHKPPRHTFHLVVDVGPER